MRTNFEKMSNKKPVGTKFSDMEGHAYIAKERREKRHKPQRGGGVKGLFRDATTLPNVDSSYIIYG